MRRPRPTPHSKHADYWQFCLALGIGMGSLGVALMITGALANTGSTGVLGGIYFIIGVLSACIAGIMYGIVARQRPISGRVIDRYFTVSGFVAAELPLTATLEDLLAGTPTEIQEPQTVYWLQVAPFAKDELNRSFPVTYEVFLAHHAGTDYDVDAPTPAADESSPAHEEVSTDK